jgi:uncharacterized membrane protein YcaP (DUF421 family)
VLIENGQLQMNRLRQEIITLPELEAAAHRQGFSSLDEIERAILEPGGALTFIGKKPDPEEARHQELVAGINRLSQEIAALRTALPKGCES